MNSMNRAGVVRSVAAAALSIGFAGAQASAQDAVQWRVEDGGNGHWYSSVGSDSPIAWTAAKALAEQAGGQLSCHETPTENQFVWDAAVQPIVQGWDGWLGLRRVNGSWQWLTGPLTYTSWSVASPDGDCGGANYAHYHGGPYDWNDLSDNGLYCAGGVNSCGDGWVCSYLIEWSADCNADGIVDYGQCQDGSLADANANNIPDCCEQGPPCDADTATQWRVEDGGNGHWYWADPTLRIRSAGSAIAASSGGHLVTITSSAENQFLVERGYASSGETFAYWTAGVRATSGGSWSWTTGEPWTYSNFDVAEPNGCCGLDVRFAVFRTYLGHEGRWDDTSSENPEATLIEWSADCNADGIVDYGQCRDGSLADANTNNIPDCCEQGVSCTPCPGDISANGIIDGVDLAVILSLWGTDGQGEFDADLNDDGIVDGFDLGVLLSGWGPCPR